MKKQIFVIALLLSGALSINAQRQSRTVTTSGSADRIPTTTTLSASSTEGQLRGRTSDHRLFYANGPNIFSEIPLANTSGGAPNQLFGLNNSATGFELKTFIAGSNIALTNGIGSITIAASALPYDASGGAFGKPANNGVVFIFKVVRPFTLPASFSGSQCEALSSATASANFTVNKKSGGVTTQIGVLNWAAGATACTVTSGTATTFAAGDLITIFGPATADATLADFSITLKGLLPS
jgi:hypothetical protein